MVRYISLGTYTSEHTYEGTYIWRGHKYRGDVHMEGIYTRRRHTRRGHTRGEDIHTILYPLQLKGRKPRWLRWGVGGPGPMVSAKHMSVGGQPSGLAIPVALLFQQPCYPSSKTKTCQPQGLHLSARKLHPKPTKNRPKQSGSSELRGRPKLKSFKSG